MKYSQFNSIIPYEDKFALYNSFANKVIFLETKLKDILITEKENNIDNLQSIYPSFYDYLVENKFIVSADIDELEEMKKFAFEKVNSEELYELTINPTMNCNFKCWYCYQEHMPSKMREETVESVKQLISKISKKEKLKLFHVSFFGGEPLIYFEQVIVPIIDTLLLETKKNKKKLEIGFTTNGYLIDDKFINYIKENKLVTHFQITLDGCKESHDKVRFITKEKGSYEHIVNNIKKLVENEMFVSVRVNYTSDNIDSTYKIADDLLIIDNKFGKENMIVDFHRVWQDNQKDDINVIVDRNIAIFKEKGINAKVTDYNPDSVRFSCYADKKNSAQINFNGDVFKCTAGDLKSECRDGYIDKNGEIIWENNSLEKRMNSKFHNKPCLTCRLLGVCNGGCSKHALDALNNKDYCMYYFDEKEKDKVVKMKVDFILQENAEK